jgi:hypothetical protein
MKKFNLWVGSIIIDQVDGRDVLNSQNLNTFCFDFDLDTFCSVSIFDKRCFIDVYTTIYIIEDSVWDSEIRVKINESFNFIRI